MTPGPAAADTKGAPGMAPAEDMAACTAVGVPAGMPAWPAGCPMFCADGAA